MSAQTARIGTLAAGSLLALGLFAGAPGAGASPASGPERQLECDGPSSAETAWKTPDRNDGDHPSGREGKGLEERGGSGTQGASPSDPDGSSNGGADKPGCDGGFDAHDRDGNNGCGNDHDFEDDNNGWCGKQASVEERARARDAKPEGDAGTSDVAGARDEDSDEDSDEYSKAATSGFASLAQSPTSATATPDAAASAAGIPATVAGETLSTGEPVASEVTSETAAPAGDDGPATEVLGVVVERPDTLARTGLGLGGLVAGGGLLLGSGRLAALVRRFLR